MEWKGRRLRPLWQILLLALPAMLYQLCRPARAYCDWMDNHF